MKQRKELNEKSPQRSHCFLYKDGIQFVMMAEHLDYSNVKVIQVDWTVDRKEKFFSLKVVSISFFLICVVKRFFSFDRWGVKVLGLFKFWDEWIGWGEIKTDGEVPILWDK